MILEQQQLHAAALRRLASLERVHCFNPADIASRPTPQQQEILEAIEPNLIRAIVAGNQSGKSQLAGREVAWIFEGKHPYWTSDKEGNKLILIIGRVGEQVETQLWGKSVKPFLEPGSFKEVRVGSALQRIEHKSNGNIIICMSHHDAEAAREKAQSYVADYVWLDEMPTSFRLISELVMRTTSNRGRFIATFTPLMRNAQIKAWADGLDPSIGRKFNLKMLDNPIFNGRHDEVKATMKDYSESEQKTRLDGDWFSGEHAVYDFDPQQHVVPIPLEYSASWMHVESVDPASSGQTGYVLAAQNPANSVWYIIDACYIQEKVPSALVQKVAARSLGKNVIRLVSDPHEAWFIAQASTVQRHYTGVFKKTERKAELVKNYQEAISKGRVKITSSCVTLIEEMSTCQRAEDGERIVNAQSYHTCDAAQYLVDNLPRTKPVPTPDPDPRVQFDKDIRVAHKARKQLEKRAKSRVQRKSPWQRSSSYN